jgi:Secretion system C-terminal sorting domain
MKIKFVLLIFTALIFREALTQPVEEWDRRYSGTANSFDLVSKMLIDKDNNVLVFGSSNETGSVLDFLIIKYSPEGNIIWTKLYNGSGNSFDHINSACIDTSGNSYVTGYTTDSEFESNFTTAKFDSSGNLKWVKVFLKPGYTMSDGKDILIDNSGNIVVCGTINKSLGSFDIETIKYTSEGDEIWSQTFNGEGNGNDIPVTLKKDISDNIVIAGTTKSLSANIDMIIIKYDSSSSLIWRKTFNGTANLDDGMSSMVLDMANNIYFCGSKYNTQRSFDYFYAKLDVNGNTLWSENYNGSGNSIDIPSSILLDSLNNVYITGFSRTGMNPGSEDILTIKLTQSGIIRWIRNYNGIANGIDQANSLAVDNSGNVYIGGATDTGNSHLVYALIKYDSLGSFEWVKKYSYSQTPEDFIYNVALDNQNNVYVTGISFSPVSDFDIATIKYSQTTGIIQSHSYITDKYILFQNYPNPFNPSTVISYQLTISNFVSLIVYDVLGNKIATLVNQRQNEGSHEIFWDASGFPSGIYFYELKTNNFSSVKKMQLIK